MVNSVLFQSFQFFLWNIHNIVKCMQGREFVLCFMSCLFVKIAVLSTTSRNFEFDQAANNRSEATSNLLGSAQKVGIAQRSAAEPMLITCDMYMNSNMNIVLMTAPTWRTHMHTRIHTHTHTYTHTRPCTHMLTHTHTFVQMPSFFSENMCPKLAP